MSEKLRLTGSKKNEQKLNFKGKEKPPVRAPWDKDPEQQQVAEQPQRSGIVRRALSSALRTLVGEDEVTMSVQPDGSVQRVSGKSREIVHEASPTNLPPLYVSQHEQRQQALLQETQALDVTQNDQFLLEQAQRSPELSNLLSTVGPRQFLEHVRRERPTQVPSDATPVNKQVFGVDIKSKHPGRGAFRGEFMKQNEVNLSDGSIYTYVDEYGETWQFTFALGQARNAEQYDLEVRNGAGWIRDIHYGIHHIGRPMTSAEIDALAHLFISKVYEQDRILTDHDLMDCLRQVGSYAQVIKHTDNLAGNPGIRASLARRAFKEGTASHFGSIMPAATGANVAIPALEAALARVESGKGSWGDIDLAYSCITALQNGPGNLYHEGHLDPYITQFQAIVAANNLQDKYSPLTTQAEIDSRPVSTDPMDYIDADTWNRFMGHK